MNTGWAILVYSASIALALLLLYFFPVRWYWHAGSLVLAVAIGFAPIPQEWSTPEFDLMIGFTFVLLVIWGLGGPFFTGHHHHHRPHHA